VDETQSCRANRLFKYDHQGALDSHWSYKASFDNLSSLAFADVVLVRLLPVAVLSRPRAAEQSGGRRHRRRQQVQNLRSVVGRGRASLSTDSDAWHSKPLRGTGQLLIYRQTGSATCAALARPPTRESCRPAARKVPGWPKRCKLARAFRWEYSYKRLKLAQPLGQLVVCLTFLMLYHGKSKMSSIVISILSPGA
jgi:hypothetical protein